MICSVVGAAIAVIPFEQITGNGFKNMALLICSAGAIIAFIEMITQPPQEQHP